MRAFPPSSSGPRAISISALAWLVVLVPLSACPGSDGDSDTVETDGSDLETDSDTSVIDVLPDACEIAADCAADGAALPACQDVDCQDSRCVFVDVADGTTCDDGAPCTSGDRCAAGVCEAGTGNTCDDANPCTSDGCDTDGTCVYTNNQRPCDDGNRCTTDDACFGGSCGGDSLDCNDLSDCTKDSCDPGTGCVNAPRAGSCDDSDTCTVGDVCTEGVCVSGAARECGNPGNVCQSATCDAVEGCILEILSGPCNDQNACTSNDACIEGVCGGEVIECNDGEACTDDFCDTTLGCTTLDNILACDDEDPCTVNDVCGSGVCNAGSANPLCCTDATTCDDADPCTTNLCSDGLCMTLQLDCGDSNPCTADLCDAGTCDNPGYGPIGTEPILVNDFETQDDIDAWSVQSTNAMVTWQSDASMTHTGTGSFYLGNVPSYSYDFGATRASAQRTLVIPPGVPDLVLWYLMDVVDNDSCNYDAMRVYINDIALLPAICASVSDWTEQRYDLSAWTGETVTLRLTFDTIEGQSNMGEGMWIDDITLEVTEAPMCCVVPSDCPTPTPSCEAATCSNGLCGVDTSGCN
jgi:hypothetical protein